MSEYPKFIELICLEDPQSEGMVSAIKLANGKVRLRIERWQERASDQAEVSELDITLDIERFRRFVEWGGKVAG